MELLVYMNDIEILMDEESEYLGLHFDRYISWTSEIDSLDLNYLFLNYFC